MENLTMVLGFGLVQGMRHAVEPDHLIAVTNLLSGKKRIRNVLSLGLYWGMGHTATLFLVGSLFILFKGEVNENVSTILEGLVGLMIVYFGGKSLINGNDNYNGKSGNHGLFHSHGDENGHIHRCDSDHGDPGRKDKGKSLVMGLVHGLAGSGALIVLTVATVSTYSNAVFFILIFGLGTTLGMSLSSALVGIPFLASRDNSSIHRLLIKTVGFLSIVYGLYYAFGSFGQLV